MVTATLLLLLLAGVVDASVNASVCSRLPMSNPNRWC